MFLSGPIILVSNAFRPGMDPAWSGRGGGGALPALVGASINLDLYMFTFKCYALWLREFLYFWV